MGEVGAQIMAGAFKRALFFGKARRAGATRRAETLVAHKGLAHGGFRAFIVAIGDFGDFRAGRGGRNAVFFVVRQLFFTAAVGLAHGALHGAGNLVRIENNPAVDIARRAPDGLDQ